MKAMMLDATVEPEPLALTLDDLEREILLLEAEQQLLIRTHEMVVDRLIEIDKILDVLVGAPHDNLLI